MNLGLAGKVEEYALAGHCRRSAAPGRNGGVSFAETAQTVMERAENNTEADKEVKGAEASRVLDSIAEHAPEEVRQAFLEAEKETGGIITVFGLWISNDGKQSHMTQMGIERFVRWYNGDFNESDLLGTTVGSAINAVKKWIYEVDHPLSGQPSGAEEKRLMAMERAFYVSFLEKLQKLSDQSIVK